MSSTTELISNPSENTGPTITAIAVLFTSLATIIVATRLWVRATMVGKIGWDVSTEHGNTVHTISLTTWARTGSFV